MKLSPEARERFAVLSRILDRHACDAELAGFPAEASALRTAAAVIELGCSAVVQEVREDAARREGAHAELEQVLAWIDGNSGYGFAAEQDALRWMRTQLAERAHRGGISAARPL